MLDHHGWHPLCHLELARHRYRHHGEFQPLGRSNGRYEPSRLGAGRRELFLLRKLLERRLFCRTLAIECYSVFSLFIGFGLVSNPCVFLKSSQGQIVGVLWLVTCISRCCAPCCCELPDVECPCSPCKLFHVIDLCFFVGFFVALWPVNIWYQLNAVPYEDWAAPFKEESFSMLLGIMERFEPFVCCVLSS